MPSTSDKQRKFMRAAAKNPKFAKKAGIKSGVAKEFYAADKRAGYAFGGGVLGKLAGRIARSMPPQEPRPVPDVRTPRWSNGIGRADRALGRAQRLRMRFKGGRSGG